MSQQRMATYGNMDMTTRKFIAIIHFNGFDNIQLGVHVNIALPNIEIHLPFCFVRIGMTHKTAEDRADHIDSMKARFPLAYKTYGIGARD